ncbi:MAG: hypothetical protein ABIP94_14055 [Planctomycetota bacterium]
MASLRTGTATAADGPLPLQAALQLLWEGKDHRPLFVLREDIAGRDTDEEVLGRIFPNDRALLLTKWFRTVRLPAHVVEASHPLHNVFDGFAWKSARPRFFLLASPGAVPMAFTGDETPSDLCKGMCDVLGQRYAKDPQRAVKEWLALLEQFDVLDGRAVQLQDQLDEARAKDGPDSPKAQKLVESLQQNAAQRVEALWRERQIRDLGLLQMPGSELLTSIAR